MKRKYSCSIDGQVLVTRVFGQWNDQHAIRFAQHIKEQAEAFNQQPFGHLLYFDEWQLASPETVPVINDLVRWLVDNGMRCAAEIFHPNALKAYLLDNMVSESRERFKIHRFDNALEGFDWLASQGFSATRKALV